MPHVLLLALSLAPADVRLDDEKRFANYTAEDAARKCQYALYFQTFTYQKRLKDVPEPDRAVLAYAALRNLKRAKDPLVKMIELRKLRKRLGPEGYEKGRVPPPYPKKYEKEFMKWLEELVRRGEIKSLPK
jgi:hypothetical protein